MKIIWSLTLKNMLSARRRTLVTILGAIISVAMITAVGTAKTTFTDAGARSTSAITGNWHYLLPDLPADQIKEAAAAFPEAQSAALYFSGFVSLRPASSQTPSYLFALSPGFEDALDLKLSEGAWPKDSTEVLLSAYQMEVLGKKPGDLITLTELHYLDGSGAAITDPALLTMEQGAVLDEAKRTAEKSYRISGCYHDSPLNYMLSNYSDALYTRFDASVPAGASQLYFNVGVPTKATSEKATQLGEQFGCGSVYNSSLLSFYGVGRREGIFDALNLLAGIVYVIIFIGSVSLIYNAFAISLTERSRQLGMLSSVGATRLQIRASVFMEAAAIGILAVPLGIFFGFFGIDVTLRLLSGALTSLMGSRGLEEGFYAVATQGSLITAALISVLTLFFSAFFPALRAGHFSPIEALRSSKDIKLRPRDVKVSRVTRRLFGFEGELALKNIKRNKNRYRATVFSLILCVVLFLSTSGFLYYTQKVTDNMLPDSLDRYNFSVYISGMDAPPSDSQLQKAEELAGAPLRLQTASPVGMSEPFISILPPAADASAAVTESISLIAVPDSLYHEMISVPSENSAILYNNIWVYYAEDGQHREQTALPVSAGDTLGVSYGESKFFFQLDSVTLQLPEQLPKGLINDTPMPLLILPQSSLLSLAQQLSDVEVDYTLYYLSPDAEAAKHAFDETDFSEEGWWYANDLEASSRPMRQVGLVLSTFLYGFIALISLVCAANIFNTVSTGVALRKREFAMLQSCGMTPHIFRRMIRFENLFYGMKALLWGWPLGTLTLLLEYQLLGTGLQVRFGLPLWGYIGSAVGVFCIVGLSMVYAGRKVRRGNIIDALKTETL
ncbi:MAG: ABC transporter permease [Oscillospiraceae bacterium]|nr:ABC transporter permease [Oscillospiraceae bacterium]